MGKIQFYVPAHCRACLTHAIKIHYCQGTPLNAVFLGMTLVRDELTNICPPAKDYVQNILETVDDVNDCCEAAISILNDLLTFDKLQEGKMTLDFEETAILEYVSESIRPFRAEARQKNIEITMRVDDAENEGWDQLSALHVDPHRMSQVLRNLLSNALKFTPSGGLVALLISRVSRREFKHLQKYPPSHVRSLKRNAVQPLEVTSGALGAAKELLNNCVRIEITDTGAGISEENQKKLFQGFEMCSHEIEDQELSLLINCSQITLMYLSISINTIHIISNKEIHFKVL